MDTLTAAAFDATTVERESPYIVEPDALRATVEAKADGTPTVTAVIGRRKNKKDPTVPGEYVLCREGSDTVTGQSLRVVTAAIRDGVISPALIKELQERGGVYAAELHLQAVEDATAEPAEEVAAE